MQKILFLEPKKILSCGDVYVGPHTSTDAKDFFLQLQKEKNILSHGDVKQVSRRRFASSVVKNHKSHTTTP
jgi:hypothetical protein